MATNRKLAQVLPEKYKKMGHKKLLRRLKEEVKEKWKVNRREKVKLEILKIMVDRSEEQRKRLRQRIDMLQSIESAFNYYMEAIRKAKEDGDTARVQELTQLLRELAVVYRKSKCI